MASWFADWANVRQQHSPTLPPAGKAVELTERPEGFHVKTLVVEPGAKELVKAGVYQAYSIGIAKARIIRDQTAKKGRVVDGIVTEISLVDYPANPVCRFQLAKSGHAGVEVVEEHIEAAPTPADLAELVKRTDPNVGGGVDRDKLPDSDFVFPDTRTFPIVIPKDVKDAVASWGRYKGTHDFGEFKAALTALARRKGAAFVAALPDGWKEPDTGKVSKGAKDCPNCGKGHDSDTPASFCADCGHKLPVAKSADAKPGLAEHREPDGDENGPDVDGDGDGKTAAYHLRRAHDATCAAYPVDVVRAAHPSLQPGVVAALDPDVWAGELTKAVGERVADIGGLAEAYTAALRLSEADPGLVDDAMAGLRKAFADAYPDVHLTPTEIDPGQFARPYLRAGRAPGQAKAGQHPHIPLSSHVPDPAQFTRPPLTDGQEAQSPSNLTKGRTYYTNAAKDEAAGHLTALHDWIAGTHPEVCAMSAEHIGSDTPMVTSAPNGASAVPTPVPVTATDQVVTRSVDADTVTHLLDESLDSRLDPILKALREMSERLHTLESSPDPAQAAPRGGLRKAAPDPVDRGEAESLARLVKMARHPDSTVSVPAYQKLLSSVGADRTADLLR